METVNWNGPGELEDALKAIENAVSHVKYVASIDVDKKRGKDESMAAQLPDYDSATFYCYQVTSPISNFTGRETELGRIRDHFNPARRSASDLRAVVIHGIGGVGKTALAQQYAAGCREPGPASFDVIFVLQCETELLVEQSFTRIARDIGFPNTDGASTRANIIRVRKWLATQSESSRTFRRVALPAQLFLLLTATRSRRQVKTLAPDCRQPRKRKCPTATSSENRGPRHRHN